jgi:hypothetical protein
MRGGFTTAAPPIASKLGSHINRTQWVQSFLPDLMLVQQPVKRRP